MALTRHFQLIAIFHFHDKLVWAFNGERFNLFIK